MVHSRQHQSTRDRYSGTWYTVRSFPNQTAYGESDHDTYTRTCVTEDRSQKADENQTEANFKKQPKILKKNRRRVWRKLDASGQFKETQRRQDEKETGAKGTGPDHPIGHGTGCW